MGRWWGSQQGAGQGRGAAHTPTACPRCPQDLSPVPWWHPEAGLHVWTHQTVWSKWPPGMKPSWQGPRAGSAQEARAPGLQPQRPRQPCVPGAAASPPEPWPLSDGHNRDRTHGRVGQGGGQPGWARLWPTDPGEAATGPPGGQRPSPAHPDTDDIHLADIFQEKQMYLLGWKGPTDNMANTCEQ